MDSKCLLSIIDYAKEAIPDATARTLREMDERFTRIQRENPNLSAAELQNVMAMIVENDLLRRAESTRAAKLFNLEVVAKGINLVSDYSTGQSLAENAIALTTGTSKRAIEGGNRGIRAVALGIEGRFLGQFLYSVDPHLKALDNGRLNRELTLEMSGVDSGSPAAKSVATSFNKILNKLFDLKKSVNPFLEKIQDYTHRQSHSRDKIVKAGFPKWSERILETHGKKSFDGMSPDQVHERLRAIYDSIDADEYSSSFLKDPSNKQRQMARERTLIPNDAESFYKYHSEFGEGTVFDVMVRTIKTAARDIAVLERLGAHPIENAKKIYQTALKNADDKNRLSYTANEAYIDAALHSALGFSDAPAKTIRAKATQFMLRAQVIGKLPGVALTLTDDIIRSMSILNNTLGTNPVSNIANLTYHYARSFISPKYAKEVAPYVWTFVDSYLGKISHDLGGVENAPGVMGKLTKMMSKANLSDAHHRGARTSIGIVVSKALADNAKLSFSEVDPVLRNHGLLRYGIKEAEWNLIRQAKEVLDTEKLKTPFNMDLLTPESIENLPDEAVTQYLRSTGKLKSHQTPSATEIIEVKSRLSNTVGAIINDLADAGSSSAGAAEKAKLYGSYDINSGFGQLLRLFGQFGTAQLKNLSTTNRVLHSGANPNKRNVSGAAALVGGGVALFALREFARSALVGQTPRDPSEPEFIAAALASGIGGGPLTDSLIHTAQQDFNPYLSKLKFAGSLLGPTFNDVVDTGTLAISSAQALFSDEPRGEAVASQAVRLLESSPFAAPFKLPYTKSVSEYYIFNELRQMGDPKYLRKQSKRMRKDEGGPLTEAGMWPERDYFMLDPRNK